MFHLKEREEKEKMSMILNQGSNDHMWKTEVEKDGQASLKSSFIKVQRDNLDRRKNTGN